MKPGDLYEWTHGRHVGARFTVVKVSTLTVEIKPLGATSSREPRSRHQVRRAFVEACARPVEAVARPRR